MKLHEECGVFACSIKDNNAFNYIKYGLMMLQHRGQESSGISCGDKEYTTIKDKGLVSDVFKNVNPITGTFGIGHVRYSTQGVSDKLHAQPFQINFYNEDIAIAHNGNISKQIISDIPTTTNSDTEIILKQLIKDINKKPSEWTFEDITNSLYKNFKEGAWALVIALPGRIIGVKDPNGYRPLIFCQADEGLFLASEDCAFNSLTINKIIEIQAGEYIEITKNNYEIRKYYTPVKKNQCVFEHIYFANPSSVIFGKNVYETRVKLGKYMAREDNIKADIVIPVMGSGLAAAIGYSEESKIPLHLGLKKNKIERSFIQPTQEEREKITKEKYTLIRNVIKDKKIILIDDSIVRGTTTKYITKQLKESGAKEVHIRLSSPPIINTCFSGIDIPDKKELIFPKFNSEKKLAKFINADSIKYISQESFNKIFNIKEFCNKCFM